MEEKAMKKNLLFAAAALVALAACTKESPVKEEGAIDASKLVFNIDVRSGSDTKGVKTAWENGDDVYVFFEDNTTQYVKMTYDGTSWSYKDRVGGTTFEGLVLAATGKKLTAVYMPDFVVGNATPTLEHDDWNGWDFWSFGNVGGYFQKAENVEYTVTSTDDVFTLSAVINLTAPDRIMQFFVPADECAEPGTGNEYALTATHVISYNFKGVHPNGTISWEHKYNGGAMQGYNGSLGGAPGYYFWGILESTGNYAFDCQLVKRNAERKYAISSSVVTKDVSHVTISSAAVKLMNFTDRGPFVDMGFGNYLWSTGNLTETSPYIADPLASGDYYKWGYTTPYDKTGTTDGYYNYISDEADFADAATAKNPAWHMLTYDQFREFYQGSYENTVWSWVGNGTIFTSRRNGLSLFFAAAGLYGEGTPIGVGDRGAYWTSTHSTYATDAYDFVCDRYNNVDLNQDQSRYSGCTIRPVWDK